MKQIRLILVDAISQYLRTGICMVLSLYSTRLILAILGQSDFGIYALIGSVVMILSSITSSLAILCLMMLMEIYNCQHCFYLLHHSRILPHPAQTTHHSR